MRERTGRLHGPILIRTRPGFAFPARSGIASYCARCERATATPRPLKARRRVDTHAWIFYASGARVAKRGRQHGRSLVLPQLRAHADMVDPRDEDPPTGGGSAMGSESERKQFVEQVHKACKIAEKLRLLGERLPARLYSGFQR